MIRNVLDLRSGSRHAGAAGLGSHIENPCLPPILLTLAIDQRHLGSFPNPIPGMVHPKILVSTVWDRAWALEIPQFSRPEPLPLREATAGPDLHRRRSHTVLSQSLWGPWVLVPLFERSPFKS